MKRFKQGLFERVGKKKTSAEILGMAGHLKNMGYSDEEVEDFVNYVNTDNSCMHNWSDVGMKSFYHRGNGNLLNPKIEQSCTNCGKIRYIKAPDETN